MVKTQHQVPDKVAGSVALKGSSEADSRRQGSVGEARHSMMLVIVALVSCILCAIAVNAGLRIVKPAIFAPFWKLLDAAANPTTNLVFIGTSRVEEGFIPNVFDEVVTEAAIGDFHSFNAGRPGEFVIEAAADAETLFKLKPQGIKFVFIEPDYLSGIFNGNLQMNTLRAINYYTVSHAYFAVEMLGFPANLLDPPAVFAGRLGRIVKATLRHYFSIGLAWADPDAPDAGFSKTSRGFHDLNPGQYRQLTPPENYRAYLKLLATMPPRLDLFSDRQFDLLLSVAADIKAHGAVPIMIGMPQGDTTGTAALIAKLSQRCLGKSPLYFDFTSPAQYPALWDPENRQDLDHLNTSGAEIFSRLIADRLVMAIKDESISRPLCGG
jgi:hypothetical protein